MIEPCLHTFTRSTYAGGRCEVYQERFDAQDKLLNYADFNSMYAWAMLGPMPVKLARKPNDLMNPPEDLLGFIRCTVRVPLDCYLPPLPYRQDGKLIFPVGTFSGAWTTAELALLPEVGGEVLNIEQSAWFEGKVMFDEYVKFWYEYRNGGPAQKVIGKQYLTNLYGKFGQSPEREKLYFFPSDQELTDHVLTPMVDTSPSMGAFVEITTEQPAYVIPHIASWVTSRSRARLWRTMFKFIKQGHRIYYCDTDSIVTDAPITDSTELGKLKLECQVKRARFVAPKLYFMETVDNVGIVKAKGFSGGFGGKGLTEEVFNGLVDRRTTVAIQRMTKLREGIKSGKRFPTKKHLRKGLRAGILDEKRTHLDDGNTKPIEVQIALGP